MIADTDLIRSALADMPEKKTKTRKVLQEFGDAEVFELGSNDPAKKSDAITKVARRQRLRENRRKRKNRPIKDWTNSDFVVFANDLLKHYDIFLLNNCPDQIAHLYDTLARCLRERMSNDILKKYIEWWSGCFASAQTESELYIQCLRNEKYIRMFLDQFLRDAPDQTEKVEADDDTLFSAGGLPMVLMSKGIVAGCRVLRDRGEKNVFTKVSKALKELSGKMLESSLNITISSAPYPNSDKVDFISIAKPAIDYHGIKGYLELRSSDYFED